MAQAKEPKREPKRSGAQAIPESLPADWNLEEWEQALTINVGTSYACRRCGNLAMVTKGGVGVMEMVCCGEPMHKIACTGGRA
jgi:hypothetical protein